MMSATSAVPLLLVLFLSATGLAQMDDPIDPAAPLAIDDECATGNGDCAVNALQVKAQAQDQDNPYPTFPSVCACLHPNDSDPHKAHCIKEYRTLTTCAQDCPGRCYRHGLGRGTCQNKARWETGVRTCVNNIEQ
mmetsp:Transcript_105718/g.264702  ORF Transcript_105718/g.264702 Transcript_105718/m.264702 type:complete len:135 (+) Transcript_105718:74-478(+)